MGQIRETTARSTLVIHPGALGDVLQAVPALRAIRPDGPLAFAGQPRLGLLLRGMGLLEAVLPFDGLAIGRPLVDDHLPAGLAQDLPDHAREIIGRPALPRTTSAGMDHEQRPGEVRAEPDQDPGGLLPPWGGDVYGGEIDP